MGPTTSAKTMDHQPLSPNEEFARHETDQRVQAWKQVWPPSGAVQPASEKDLTGRIKVLHQGGGAYPNFIKATEGIRL